MRLNLKIFKYIECIVIPYITMNIVNVDSPIHDLTNLSIDFKKLYPNKHFIIIDRIIENKQSKLSYLIQSKPNNEVYLFKLNDFNRGQVLINNTEYLGKLNKIIENIYKKLDMEYSMINLDIDTYYTVDKTIVLYLKEFFNNEITVSNDDLVDIKSLRTDIEILSESYLLQNKYKKSKNNITKLEPVKSKPNVSVRDNMNDLAESFKSESSKMLFLEKMNNNIINNKDLSLKQDPSTDLDFLHNKGFTPLSSEWESAVSWNNMNNQMIMYSDIASFNEDFLTDQFAYLAQQWTSNEKDRTDLFTVYILYCNSLNMSIIYNKDSSDSTYENIIKNINNDIKDLEYIECFELISENIVNQLNNYFEKANFDNIEDLKTKVNSFKILNNITLPEQKSEKELVIGFINQNYNLSNEPNKKMKSSIIQDEIEKGLNLFVKDKNAFSKRISSYLLELKLNKKRYSDGIYYYGIQRKVDSINFEKNVDELNNDFNERLKEYSFNKK